MTRQLRDIQDRSNPAGREKTNCFSCGSAVKVNWEEIVLTGWRLRFLGRALSASFFGSISQVKTNRDEANGGVEVLVSASQHYLELGAWIVNSCLQKVVQSGAPEGACRSANLFLEQLPPGTTRWVWPQVVTMVSTGTLLGAIFNSMLSPSSQRCPP